MKIKSQIFKSYDLAPSKKDCSFLPNLATFYRIFLKHWQINLYIFTLYVILTFKSWKKILKIFLLTATIFQKVDIISDVITAIASILIFFSAKFFVTLLSTALPISCQKHFSIRIYARGRYVPPIWCMIRQKFPGTRRVKVLG